MCFALEDAAQLAVLSSIVHVLWTLENGGTLEDRPIYTKSRCFDPFPFPDWTDAQHDALDQAGETLEAFRRARLAEHPDLTLTRLYNALEAHRAGRVPEPGLPNSMSACEARDFTRASVLVLAELHAAIDRLALDAYGWSDLADPPPFTGEGDREAVEGAETLPATARGQILLARLVALNAERAAAEARGDVRWLRPDYQRPRFGAAQGADPAAARLDLGAAAAPAGRLPWPREPRYQVLEIKTALAEAAPLTVPDLLSRFKGRGVTTDVPRLLQALQREGQVREFQARYSLLQRAA